VNQLNISILITCSRKW